MQGNTTFSIYVYVTWVDSATDGLGGADGADGNGDGVDDSGGQDTKRTTIVTVWHDSIGAGAIRQLSASSLFSIQEIFYRDGTGGTPANQPPSVGCPTASVSDLTVTFTAAATDSDGTISSITWDFGDGQTGTGSSVTHTYASAGTYDIVNTATDDDGATGHERGPGVHGHHDRAVGGGRARGDRHDRGGRDLHDPDPRDADARRHLGDGRDDAALGGRVQLVGADRVQHVDDLHPSHGGRDEDRLRAVHQRLGDHGRERLGHDHPRHHAPGRADLAGRELVDLGVRTRP